MKFAFSPDQPPGENARAVALGQLRKVEKILVKPDADCAVQVLFIRRRLKRVRAALELAAGNFDTQELRSVIRGVRDNGRELSSARDADQASATLGNLTPFVDSPKIAEVIALAQAALAAADIAQAKTGSTPDGAAFDPADLSHRIRATRDQVTNLTATDTSTAPLHAAVVKTYRAARRAMKTALKSSQSEDFHDWRKPVQRHARQLKLIEPYLEPQFAGRQPEARDLARLLGTDHDLAVTEAVVVATLNREISGLHIAGFQGFIKGLQTGIRSDAASRGEILFAPTPAKFGELLRAAWPGLTRGK